MIRLLFLFTFSFISLLIPLESFSTHVMGAEFEWEEIGQDTFLIKVNVYRDCNGVNLSATPINIFSSCGTQRLNTTKSSGIDVTPICKEQCSRCDSRGCSFQYGIEKYVLSATFVASSNSSCCNYTLTWQQCCRNGAITTGAANQNFYLESKMSACQVSELSWNSDAIAIGCLGRDAYMDLSISTTNASDSIVYKFTDPLASASATATYSSPYSYDKPIYYLGFPKTNLKLPRGIHLSASEGSLRFRPMKTEQTVMAVKAEVYRNKTLIASSTRDIQYVIIKCPDNNVPYLTGFDSTSFAAKSFERTICANTTAAFKIYSKDKDKKDTVSISFDRGIGDSVKIRNKNQSRQIAEWFWTPTSNDISSDYQEFKLNVIDNACPVSLRNSSLYRIKVIGGLPKNIGIKSNAVNTCGLYSFKIDDTTNYNYSNVKWYLNDSILIGDKEVIIHSFDKKGKYKLTLVVNDCDSAVITDTINVINSNSLKVELNDTATCGNKIVVIKPKVSGNTGSINYQWNVDKAFGYTGSLTDSFVSIDLRNISGRIEKPITVTVSDSLNCSVTKEVNLTRKFTTVKNIENSRVICYGETESITLNTISGSGTWIGHGVTNNTIDLEDLNFTKYLYAFVYQDDYTCDVDTFTLDYRDLPKVNAGNDISTCLSADNQELSPSPENGSWSNTQFISNGEFDHKSAGKGSYTYTYGFTDAHGCKNEDTLEIMVHDYTPTIIVTDTARACKSEEFVILKADKSGGTWSGTGILSNANPLKVKPSDLGSGTWPVYYNYSDSNQCSSTDTSIILVDEAPLISINVTDSNIAKGDTLSVKNNTISQNNVDYNWRLGNPAFITSSNENFNEVIDSVGTFDLTLIATDKKTGCIDTLVLEDAIIVSNGNSVSELDKTINVYPNPVSIVLNIKSDERIESLEIYSLEGKLMSRITNTNSINVAEFSNGIYLLKVQTVNKIYQTKIYKQ